MDLDDEELKATRRMNGSDKDVGSMEGIEILEKFTKIVKGKDYNAKNGWHGYYDEELMDLGIAIENLIKAYKELEEENKDLKNLANNKQWISPCYVAQNFIPVSLVEEKIEELNRKIKYENNEKVIIWLHKQRKILQELLERRK